MSWIQLLAVGLVLADSAAWGATLSWTANTDLDLAGYRVYQCNQLPCGRTTGNATSLATLGKVTSFNIGTPAVIQYYVITAYDFANNESSDSNVTTYTPATSTPSTPPPTVPPPAIGINPVSLGFTAQQGSGNPLTQVLNIRNAGGGTLSWSAGENSNWLTLSPASGTGNGTMTIAVTTGTRIAGTYSGMITVSATGASTVTIPVTFTITAPTPSSTPQPPPAPGGLRLTAVN